MVNCAPRAQQRSAAEGLQKMPDLCKDDLARRRLQARLAPSREAPCFVTASTITQADLQTWERLKVSEKARDADVEYINAPETSPEIKAETALRDDFANRKTRAYKKTSGPRQKFVHFGPVTEIDQQKWQRLSIGKAGPRKVVEIISSDNPSPNGSGYPTLEVTCNLEEDQMFHPQTNCSQILNSGVNDYCKRGSCLASISESQEVLDHSVDGGPRKMEEVTLEHIGTEEHKEAAQRDSDMPPKRAGEHDQPIYGPRIPVSDDAESTSMFDMRCEEEAAVQPHSRARQEQLQMINTQLREEDDKWQDDLARWKSRRRSASQDLIKKEEERKKMEKLLAGEDGISERRKSIKTYREIVQEKERRERELHEAYKNARSQEEAEGILQQYIERFTISEAVLERLEMPKILERSHSTEPNFSSLRNDPNPMKYLRQQSLPPPKFTATVETTIARPDVQEASVEAAGSGSPSKTVPPKAVPMLTPKPYSQPKNSQEVLKTFKVDGKVSMNGETVHGDEVDKERECLTLALVPSLTSSQTLDAVASVKGSPEEMQKDNSSIKINIKKPSSALPKSTNTTEDADLHSQENEHDGEKQEEMNSEFASSEPQHFTTTVTRSSPSVAYVEFVSSPQQKNDVPEERDLKKPGNEMSGKVELVLSQKVIKPKSPEPEATLAFPILDKLPETNQLHLPNLHSQVNSPSSEKSPASTPFKFWAWDPEEERRRQEKWQQEQERLLQERYQKEQDKLKEEWEKAQKEVEEEERRYYEEERKIIEDTVVPFTISSSSADQLSAASSITEGSVSMNKMDLENGREEERMQKKLSQGDHNDLLLKNRECAPPEGKSSPTPGVLAHSETPLPQGLHEGHLLDIDRGASHCEMNPQLVREPAWNQQISKSPTPSFEDVKPKTLPLDKNINHQIESPSERRKSISGKKLCSSCGLPLGKGAAMIIETLNLYFHIQCFRCGICKGQLGDAVSGTDVRIRNGLLNCNDCYMRSRSAGQPTML